MFPLFILPFDHRAGFAREVLKTTYPFNDDALKEAKRLKQIIFEGFLLTKDQVKTEGTLAILIDEESGEEIIEAAKSKNVPHIITTEASGAETFTYAYGENLSEALKRLQPTLAKALVNYRLGDEERNAKQRKEIKKLADYCATNDLPWLLEVLTGKAPAEAVAKTLVEFEEAGIRPTVWKLEGFSDPSAWKTIRKVTDTPIVVLGHGETNEEVDVWVKVAAESGLEGIAIGRTVFLKPLKELVAGNINEETAKKQIAHNFKHFIDLWESSAK